MSSLLSVSYAHMVNMNWTPLRVRHSDCTSGKCLVEGLRNGRICQMVVENDALVIELLVDVHANPDEEALWLAATDVQDGLEIDESILIEIRVLLERPLDRAEGIDDPFGRDDLTHEPGRP